MVIVIAIPHNNPKGFVAAEWSIGHKNECGASWTWNGSLLRPTLSPSLHAVGIWHGFVKDGVMTEC